MLSNKVIVVTGGAGLLGREFVRGIVGNNGTAIIADLHAGKLDLQDLGLPKKDLDRIDILPMDITSQDSITNLIAKVLSKHDKIDALVNNAYPRNENYGRAFFAVEYEDFVENLGLNLGGYFLTSKLFAELFNRQKNGNIVNISSVYGLIAPRFEIYEGTEMTTPVEYAAIKAGLIHLTKYMAKYFKGMNIRVNSLSPGGIEDNQPLKFKNAYQNYCSTKGMLEKSDLVGSLIFLLSDMSQLMTGQNIIVDDGFTL